MTYFQWWLVKFPAILQNWRFQAQTLEIKRIISSLLFQIETNSLSFIISETRICMSEVNILFNRGENENGIV